MLLMVASAYSFVPRFVQPGKREPEKQQIPPSPQREKGQRLPERSLKHKRKRCPMSAIARLQSAGGRKMQRVLSAGGNERILPSAYSTHAPCHKRLPGASGRAPAAKAPGFFIVLGLFMI